MRRNRDCTRGGRVVRRRQSRGLGLLSRIAWRSIDDVRRSIAVKDRRRPRIVLVGVWLSRHARVWIVHRHAIVLLGCAIRHVSRVHVWVHVLLVILGRILLMVRRWACMGMWRRTSPPRSLVAVMPRHRANNRRGAVWHVYDGGRHAGTCCTLRQRYVLPSRQMAVTHPAGLGFSFDDGCRPALVRRPYFRSSR